MVPHSTEIARDPDIEEALAALAVGNAARAEGICRVRLAREPESFDHLRLLGRALAMQSRAADAEPVLRRALALRPDFPPLLEDLGGVLAMQQRFDDALASFETALKLDPRLPFARKKLGEALAALGRGPEADKAFESWFEESPDRVFVAVALDHLQAGRKDDAISNLRKAIKANPDNVDALHTLAQAYWGNDKKLSDVEAMLQRVLAIAPAHVSARMMLGSLFHESERPERAIACFERVVELEPGNAAAWSSLGQNCALIGDMDRSTAAYARSLALDPARPGIHMSYAHALKAVGRRDEALREYRAAIESKPEFGEAYWSMANLKVFRFESGEVEAMEAQLARDDLGESTRVHFHFALGKSYEDAGDYDRAWAHYDAGNRGQRPLVPYDPVEFEVLHERIREVFTAQLFEQHAGEGCESEAPIFIVGLPRSGSTLIEQILASHSQVEGTLELSTLGKIAMSTARYRRDCHYPETMRQLRAADIRAYGDQYMDQTRIYRTAGRPRFTDKLPNNFSHVGFAHLILPNARIINARRHPLDSLLGNYKQLYGKGQNFTYDVNELGLYYRQYHETMRHWHRVLPGKVLDVHYEETVGDFEGQVRRILAHCGLPFEEACLRFHETERAVKTASSEQVREPLYTRALGTWRRYEKYLGPWQEELADVIESLPDSVRNAGL
jgi:tetratricopeptide (TPR) repeat protein